jgi:hypothetical protein
MESSGKNHHMVDGPGEDIGLDIAMDEYAQFLDGIMSSVPMVEKYSLGVGDSLATPAGTSVYGPAFPELLNEEETNRQISLALAIWESWHSGDFSQLDSLSDAVESYYHLWLDISQTRPINLDLKAWLALDPLGGYSETTSQSQVPSSLELNTPVLDWKMYTKVGYDVASQKEKMTLIQRQTHISQSTGRLVASMLLAADRSADLRQGFYSILIDLEPILRDQFNDLEIPCRKFAKYFPHRHTGSGDRTGTGNSAQRHEAAMLAMACDRKLKALGNYHSLAFKNAEEALRGVAGFSMDRALLWAARLVLYHASPKLVKSPLPSDLCARALDGCRRTLEMVNAQPGQSGAPSGCPNSEKWLDATFASMWAGWICCDSDFFLHDSPK